MWLNKLMQLKNSVKKKIQNDEFLEEDEIITEKKVDINILLNRVKVEQKDKIRKNFIITAGAIGTLAITGIISII